jgi:3-deoxy-D-manno-octulosonate 8-phosphate phosphatase (KDO 8-P phosphatase)
MNGIPESTLARIKPIQLILMDVDGTLSDGKLFYDANWIEGKSFNVRDGFGIYLAHSAGLKTGMITGRNSRLVSERARELEMEFVFQGHFDKSDALDEIMRQSGLREAQIAFIGDDLFDLPVLMRAGFSAAPADADPEVLQRVHFVSRYPGGGGAVREIIELILKLQGRWENILNQFITDRQCRK